MAVRSRRSAAGARRSAGAFIARLVVLAVIVFLPVFAASASADSGTVTITGTQVLPVPPASNFAGNSGGDGWSVALSPQNVYNVFHHQGAFFLSCHTQA